MALDQGRIFVGNKTYIVQVMTATNNLTIEWLGFVDLTNLNMSKKLLICFHTFAWVI